MPRLDVWLVDTGHFSSRQLAKRAIKEGKTCKPSANVTGKENIKILTDAANMPIGYLKLEKLDKLMDENLVEDPCLALDIGSSAGGFLLYLQFFFPKVQELLELKYLTDSLKDYRI